MPRIRRPGIRYDDAVSETLYDLPYQIISFVAPFQHTYNTVHIYTHDDDNNDVYALHMTYYVYHSYINKYAFYLYTLINVCMHVCMCLLWCKSC